jgi:predicted nucleic acid-binding protein
MNIEIATDVLRDIKSLKSLTPVDQNRCIEDSLKIAVVNGITVYDALFIVLAKELKMVQATCDRKQAEAALSLKLKRCW